MHVSSNRLKENGAKNLWLNVHIRCHTEKLYGVNDKTDRLTSKDLITISLKFHLIATDG